MTEAPRNDVAPDADWLLAEVRNAFVPERQVAKWPINGTSWLRKTRGIAGNMNVFEAAELAGHDFRPHHP